MNKTKKLAFTAMLAALSVLANAFSVPLTGSNYLSFTYLPCFVAAIYLGIVPATVVGFVGDLIAGLLFPKGAYNLLIALASTLVGTISGVCYKFLPKRRLLALIVSLVACTVVCTSGINTYALWLLFGVQNGKTFWVYLGTRLPFQLLNTVLNGVIIGILQQTRVLDNLFEPKQQKAEEAEGDTTTETAEQPTDESTGENAEAETGEASDTNDQPSDEN